MESLSESRISVNFDLPISDIIFWNWNRNQRQSQNSWNRSHVNILKWSRSRNQNARVESESGPGLSGTAHLWLGPKKGVFPTPGTGPFFFPPDIVIDIPPKIIKVRVNLEHFA